MLYSAVFGGIGGLARTLVGILKSLRRKEKFNFRYWSITILISIIIGLIVGAVFPDIRLALLGGYGGTDIIEGLYKGLIKK